MHIINKRKLNPYKAFVNIAVDGGGGFLKVACNVFDPKNLHSYSSKYQDSGVQRIQILAIVEDIPESNWNLGLILSKLKLEEVNYYIAFDLNVQMLYWVCLLILENMPVYTVQDYVL